MLFDAVYLISLNKFLLVNVLGNNLVVEKKEGCVLTQSRVGWIPCTTLTLDAIEQNLPILEYGKLELLPM